MIFLNIKSFDLSRWPVVAVTLAPEERGSGTR